MATTASPAPRSLALISEGTASILTGDTSEAGRRAERPQTVRVYSIEGGEPLIYTRGEWTIAAAVRALVADLGASTDQPPETATVWCENPAHGSAPRNAHHFTPECVHPHYTGSHQPRPADRALQQLADLRCRLDQVKAEGARRSVERLRELAIESQPEDIGGSANRAIARDHAAAILDRLDELGAQLAAMTRQRDHALTQVRRVQTDLLGDQA